MQKLLLITAVFTVVGVCNGQIEMPACPVSPLEAYTWSATVQANCQKQFMAALMESNDNCAEKVGGFGPCLTAEKDKCTASMEDGELKNMVIESLDSLIEASAYYPAMYCSSGPMTDMTMKSNIAGCSESEEMTAASQQCHAPFVGILNEFGIDTRLCDAYSTMVTCETDKVKELCPDADSTLVAADDLARRMMNYYCVDAPVVDTDGNTADGGNENACPTSMMDVGVWLIRIVTDCTQEMMTALRRSKDNCGETIGQVEPCIMAEKDQCLEQDDSMEMMINAVLGDSLGGTANYSDIFCSTGPVKDITMPTQIRCNDDGEMTNASLQCHAPFVDIFNEDRVDSRLCDAYDTMVTCESDKVKELCPDADSNEVEMDEQARQMGNVFCIDDDDDDAASDDGKDSATSIAVSFFTFIVINIMSVSTIIL